MKHASLTAKMCLVAAALASASCAAVRSDAYHLSQAARAEGLHYSMPRGLLRVAVITNEGRVQLTLSKPILVGDAEHSFTLDGNAGLLSDEQYRFVVEPQTRLLSYVNSSSEGRAAAIVTNLTRSAAGVSPSMGRLDRTLPSVSGQTIYTRVFDPMQQSGCGLGIVCRFSEVEREISDAVRAGLGCEGDDVTAQIMAQCNALLAHPIRITLEPLYSLAAPAAISREQDAQACRAGVCYRPPLPYALTAEIGGHLRQSEVISLPNEAPIMSMRVPAGVFARSRSRIELYRGMPAVYVVDRQNEMEAIALLPFQIVRAGFQAISDVVQLRINYNVDQRREEESAERAPAEARPSAVGAPAGEAYTPDTYGSSPPQGNETPWASTSFGVGEVQFETVSTISLEGSGMSATALLDIDVSGALP